MSESQDFAFHPQAARRVREDLLGAIRALVPFPHQGHRRPDLTSRPLRFTTVRDYLIAYAPLTALKKVVGSFACVSCLF